MPVVIADPEPHVTSQLTVILKVRAGIEPGCELLAIGIMGMGHLQGYLQISNPLLSPLHVQRVLIMSMPTTWIAAGTSIGL